MIILGGAIGLATRVSPSTSVAGPTEAGPGKLEVALSDHAAWAKRLEAPGRIQFVTRTTVSPSDASTDIPASDSVIAELTSLGHLSDRDLPFANAFFESWHQLQVVNQTRARDNLDPTSAADAYTEAKAACDYEVALRMKELFDSGNYITLPPGQSVPATSGVEAMSFATLKDGQQVNVWLLLDLEKHEDIGRLARYRDSVQTVWLDEVCLQFNSLPVSVRQELIAIHQARIARPQSSWTAGDLANENRWFPGGLWPDPDSALLTRNR